MIDIDTPDFDQALASSSNGSFHRAVQTYLEAALADIHRQLRGGLSPLEFEQAKKIEAAIAKASDVIRLSSPSN
jgi:hypothetical protein